MSPHDRNIVFFFFVFFFSTLSSQTGASVRLFFFFAFYAQHIMYNRSERHFVVEFMCVTFCYRYQCSLKYDLKSQKKVNETVSVEVCWVIKQEK